MVFAILVLPCGSPIYGGSSFLKTQARMASITRGDVIQAMRCMRPWRKADQNDVTARIAWTLTPKFAGANHAPHAVLKGDSSFAPLPIEVKFGEKNALSAAEGRSPAHRNWGRTTRSTPR